jgi:hypothetical protein
MAAEPVPNGKETPLIADDLFCQDPNCKYCRDLREGSKSSPAPNKAERAQGD